MTVSEISGELKPAANTGIKAYLWRAVGLLCVGIGVANAFIPLLPTTVFLIAGVWAFGKGAPEWRHRMLRHPRYGEPLRQWQDGGRISRRGKKMALTGMAASFIATTILLGLGLSSVALGGALLLIALWLWRRPEPR